MSPLNVTEKLANFAVSLKYDELPADVIDNARMAIIDCMGTVFAGIDEPSVQQLREVALADYRDGAATVLGCNKKNSVLPPLPW